MPFDLTPLSQVLHTPYHYDYTVTKGPRYYMGKLLFLYTIALQKGSSAHNKVAHLFIDSTFFRKLNLDHDCRYVENMDKRYFKS